MLRLRPSRLSATSLSRLRHRPAAARLSSSFVPPPSPPKLPADQQAEFERLQRAAAVSSAFQPQSDPAPPATQQPRHATESAVASRAAATHTTAAAAGGDTDDVNRGLFRGAAPEFKGDVNPRTGEVGGPKNEPLRWGGDGDWSYNGRVTDF